MVEIRGLEPRTSCMPCKRSSQLSYIPMSRERTNYTESYLLFLVVVPDATAHHETVDRNRDHKSNR